MGTSGDSPQFSFSLWKGSENLAEIDASGNELTEGQSTKMDTYSDSNLKKVPPSTTIKVADAW